MKLILLAVLGAGPTVLAAPPALAATFDFETGDLQGWQIVDGSFGKPVTDLAKEHNSKRPYTKGGRYFLSTLETKRDTPDDGQMGRIESPLVRLAGPKISFRIGGGRAASLALVDRRTGRVYASATGENRETMRVVVWDVPDAVGKDVFFRVTDEAVGSWCHVTVDDIAFEGTVGAADFAARKADFEKRLPKDFPAAAAHAPSVLIVRETGEFDLGTPLAAALRGRVALAQVDAVRAKRRLAEEKFDLVLLQGGQDVSGFVGDALRNGPDTKVAWIATKPCGWGALSSGVPVHQVQGRAAAAVADEAAGVVTRSLGLDPATAADFARAARAIDELAVRFPGRYPAARLRAAGARLRAETASRASLDAFLKEALVQENPLVAAHEIVYATREMWQVDHHNTATIFQYGEVNQNGYRTQGALKALDVKTGSARVIVPEVGERTVRDPEVDYDGRRIVFSMRAGKADDYHIYTVNSDGSDLKQLTRAKGVSDIDPVWLPDGGILFGSTREPKYCMCNRHIMCNLFRMEADGANIRQIGKSTLFEGHPTVLPDGRILYDRWEYVDRNFGDAQGLWVCNPDGTRHAIYWGNNTTSPGGVINARPLSNPSMAIATLGSCHDLPWGALGIIDRSRGVDGREPVLRTWPAEYRARIHTDKEDFDSTRPLKVKYADVFPLDDEHFICTRTIGRGREMALVYLDLHGNEVVFHRDGPGCHSPVVLRKTRKPVVQSEQRNFDAPDAPGRFYVQNIYAGTHMQGVKPGSVKAIRVVESPEKRTWIGCRGWFGHGEEACAMNWHSFENKRILGTVPVEADGSAYFEVPGNTFVYFQALDADGKMVQSMRSGAYLQPGELYGCVGCHEDRVADAPKMEKQPMAMRRAPSKLDGAYNLRGLEKGTRPHLYSFQKEVQPVFTAKCASCHDYGKKAGEKLNLSGDLGAYFCTSYVDLWALGFVTCVGGGPAEIRPAYSWGAHASKLTKKLDGHGKVRLTDDERDRIVTWMDINAPYWPCYECAWPDNYGGRMPITRAEHAELEKLTGVKIATGHRTRQREQLNFTRPERSRILAGVAGTPAGEKALGIIQAGAARLKENPRADMDGFVPCAKDRERECRYQRRLAEERNVYKSIRTGGKTYDAH
ncbi:MAG: hypothetical protein ACI4Q3_09695 [Kiritimatiellia bacterium]